MDMVDRVVAELRIAEFEFWSASPLAIGVGWKEGLLEAMARAAMKAAGSMDELRRLGRQSNAINATFATSLARGDATESMVMALMREI